ncbi:MAG: hypothetical protein ABSF63_11090 [Candidatus Bathyarchaeia archaeon]|jgi:hypothetical protein
MKRSLTVSLIVVLVAVVSFAGGVYVTPTRQVTSFRTVTENQTETSTVNSTKTTTQTLQLSMPNLMIGYSEISSYLADPNKPKLQVAAIMWSYQVTPSLTSSLHQAGVQVVAQSFPGCGNNNAEDGPLSPYVDIWYMDEPYLRITANPSQASCSSGSIPAWAPFVNHDIAQAHLRNPNIVYCIGESYISDIEAEVIAGIRPDCFLGEAYSGDGYATYSYLQSLKTTGTVRYIGMWTTLLTSTDAQILRNGDTIVICDCFGNIPWATTSAYLQYYGFEGTGTGIITVSLELDRKATVAPSPTSVKLRSI